MIISCGYKQNNYCDYHEKDLNSIKDCTDCHYAVSVYTDKDKISLLYKALKDASKEKSAKSVEYLMCLNGHCSNLAGDFDDIYYIGYSLWLLLHKRYKLVTNIGLVLACESAKLMGIKIPKGVRRKFRRFKKNHYKEYEAIVKFSK